VEAQLRVLSGIVFVDLLSMRGPQLQAGQWHERPMNE
jgi:hypothetical protein